MSKALDAMLLTEMEQEDHQDALTADFGIIDTLYDEDSGDPYGGIFSKDIDPDNDIDVDDIE